MRGRIDRESVLAAILAVVGGAAVYLVATTVFPYHSVNHDEAVYLQQAAMLLDGRLFLRPPVPEAFRPWFFVADGGRLYPKYAPVSAATFALGDAVAGYRLSLATVAAANVWLTWAVVSELFDRTTGVLAAAFLLSSPLFLVDSSVFLPYAPTMLWTLLFALGYLRADRTGSRRWAATAGLAIGVAFFARPYTAVLFAAPFVVHAVWTLRTPTREVVVRQGAIAAVGLAGVGLALAYNAAVTGSPWLFPYEAFAPRDGLGFGHHEIAGYGRTYTPLLALRANAAAVTAFLVEWAPAAPVGPALAAVGLGTLVRRGRRTIDPRAGIIAGLFLSIVAGNVYFWGNLNVLGALGVPDDGLIAYLGPYYHFGLLLPTSAFAARGALVGLESLRQGVRGRVRPATGRLVVAGALLAATLVITAAAGAAVAEPIRRNGRVTDHYARAYEPFEDRPLDDALVFMPAPYGPWLNHPFQALRNDPGYDGDVVYALEEHPFAVADAFPGRRLYRYTYRGEWAPSAGRAVRPRLQPVRQVRGERLVANATITLPRGVDRVSIRLASPGDSAYYTVARPSRTLRFGVIVDGSGARLVGDATAAGDGRGRVAPGDELVVRAFADHGTGSGPTYRLAFPVATGNGTVRGLTPSIEVCHVPDRCGGEAAYVPGPNGTDLSVDIDLSGTSGEAS